MSTQAELFNKFLKDSGFSFETKNNEHTISTLSDKKILIEFIAEKDDIFSIVDAILAETKMHKDSMENEDSYYLNMKAKEIHHLYTVFAVRLEKLRVIIEDFKTQISFGRKD